MVHDYAWALNKGYKMYFEFNFRDNIHLFFLKINADRLDEGYIAGTVIKEMSEIIYYNHDSYAFETKCCTIVTDPIIINELDKLITFK